MTKSRLAISCVILFVLAGGFVDAQETRIKIVQSGVDNLLNDLKDIVTLTTNKRLQKEWKNLEETLDIFLIGFDRVEPIRMDLVITTDGDGKSSYTIVPSFPVAKFEGNESFVENIESFEFKIKEKPAQKNLYELTQPRNKTAKPMFMRVLDVSNAEKKFQYAVIAPKETDVPADLPNPADAVKHLLKPGADLALELKNDAAGIEQRKKEFEGLRKELEAAIKFKRDEDKSGFELRKLQASQVFDEAERFLVESDLLTVFWTTESGAKSGQGELTLTALPGTSLLESIRQIAQKPSEYAHVQLHENGVLSGKWCFPFDEMRKAQAKLRHPLLRDALKVKIDQRESLTAEGKVAAKEALEKLIEIFDASLERDVTLDGFVDMYADEQGKHTGIMAMSCGKAKLADDIVASLSKIRDDWKVRMKAHEHNGVTIHEIAIPARRAKHYDALFSGEPILYIGTSEHAVWAGCGKNALNDLKAAIDQQAKPAPEKADPVFFSGTMKFGPWIKLLDLLREEKPTSTEEKKSKEELRREKEQKRIRELALEAFASDDDILTGKLMRNGDEIQGELSITVGVFRFIGSAIADFSKENLQ